MKHTVTLLRFTTRKHTGIDATRRVSRVRRAYKVEGETRARFSHISIFPFEKCKLDRNFGV